MSEWHKWCKDDSKGSWAFAYLKDGTEEDLKAAIRYAKEQIAPLVSIKKIEEQGDKKMSQLSTNAIVECIGLADDVGWGHTCSKAEKQLQALLDRITDLEKHFDLYKGSYFPKTTYPDGSPMYDPDSAVWAETE